MKFNTSKQKLPKLDNRQKTNNNFLQRQLAKNKPIRVLYDKLNKFYHSNQDFLDLSSDWVNLEPVSSDSDGNLIFAYYNWIFDIPIINQNLLNKIRYDILYKFGSGEELNEGDFANGTVIRHGMILDFKFKEISSILKEGSINISVGFQRNLGIQEHIQVKLLLYIFNPNLYQTW